MEIVIHGTKGGRKIFTPNKLPGLFDVTSNSPNSSSIGNEAYAIRFVDNYTILSKYKIIRDVLGDKRTGFIAFSLFVPRYKKLPGVYIINLLDEVSEVYSRRGYIIDNNLGNVEENWDFISQVKDELKPVDEHILSGPGDDAFIYFKNREEIQRYFDNPFQEEYRPFRQIYFVDENFNNKPENPLNALLHNPNANLTGKKILENPWRKLRNYDKRGKDGVSIEIRANGISLNDGDKIFENDNVTIKYSKKNHVEIVVHEGKLSEPQIAQYLKISDNSIDVEKNIDLKPTEIPFEIRINDSKGTPITNADITCKRKYTGREIQVSQNTIVFVGEEQEKEWTIFAQAGNLIGEKTMTPEHERSSLVTLTLREVKIIKLQIQDEKGILIPNKSKDLTFYDDEIRQKHTEPINVSDYQPRSVTFTPKDVVGDAYKVKLQKQDDKQSGHGGSGKKESKKHFFLKILLGLSVACLLVFGVCFLVDMFKESGKNSEDMPPTETSQLEPIKSELSLDAILSYVEGDSLFLDKLNNYKNELGNPENRMSHAEIVKYTDFVDKAIKKREAIIDGNFTYFNDNKNEDEFSKPQQPFKKAVQKIKKDQHLKVKTELGDVSKLTLTQIADSINKILAPPNKTNNTTEKKKTQPKKEDTNQNEKKSNQPPPLTDEEKEIIKYLEGDKFNFQILEKYDKSNTSQKLKPSIKLALKFWSLDGLKPNTYFTYFQKVNNDYYLKNNEKLTSFLEDENQKKTDNTYPNSIPGFKTLTLSKFIEKAK